jgi:hypothetical protein
MRLPLSTTLIEGLRERLEANGEEGLGIRKAAAILGMHVKRTAELRRDGVIPTIFHLQNDRPIPLLEPRAVEAVVRGLRATLAFEDAASQLGISYHGVEQLPCLRLLKALVVPATRSEVGVRRICKASVNALAAQIEAPSRRAVTDAMPLNKRSLVRPDPRLGAASWRRCYCVKTCRSSLLNEAARGLPGSWWTSERPRSCGMSG